jgi:triacylglycerol lipase
MGFVQLAPRVEYFRGVRRMLEREGNRVFAWKSPNLATVESRAEVLLGHLRRHESEGPFHLIAHSMGGLDARCLISTLGGADLVASLTTIATPHHGTEAADWRNRVLARLGLLRWIGRRRGLFSQMETFTRGWAARFDDRNPEVPHVRYRCWAGKAPRWGMTPLLQWLCSVMRCEGPNDGVVSVASATLRPELLAGVVPADHFAQLGWKLGLNRLDRFDHMALYRGLVRDLVEAEL